MNANELADALDDVVANYIQMIADVDFSDVATMLRQQQAEIEDLKNANRFIQNFAEEQHQRAVALESELDRAVELYTALKADGKILMQHIADMNEEKNKFHHQTTKFARAILRKAQEK